MTSPILTARKLNKRYGRVIAMEDCDFDLMPGEILAVIGDNGARQINSHQGLVWRSEAGQWRNPP